MLTWGPPGPVLYPQPLIPHQECNDLYSVIILWLSVTIIDNSHICVCVHAVYNSYSIACMQRFKGIGACVLIAVFHVFGVQCMTTCNMYLH